MKQNLIILCLVFFYCSINNNILSQRTCGSVDKMKEYFSKNPEKKSKRLNLEDLIINDVDNEIPKLTMNIPVVFHIIYNTPEQNISDAQILSQLDVLNEDFNRTNADAFNVPSDFDSIVASMQINFCLSKQDPNGNLTNGILRKQTSINGFNLFDSIIHYDHSGGSDAWDTDKYLNIWVCKINSGILGWAQFPAAGVPETDGVVIDYQHFGTLGTAIYPYNKGRTTTHEIGHYFNLFHTWGDNYCGDDWVNDTPIQEGPNYGCSNHPSPSCNNNGDMYMNYMDYSDDACMNSFTIGQRNRLWSSLYNYRLSLLSSYGCNEIAQGNPDAKIEIIFPIGEIEGCHNPLYPEVVITNKSNETLYTGLIKYKVNGSNFKYQSWNGTLNQNEKDTILLSGFAIGGNNHIVYAKFINPNNSIDLDSSNNYDSQIFKTNGGTNININLITDNYADENSWKLLNQNNNVIDQGQNLLNNTHYIYNYCLENSCYKFIINDSYGDGFCCSYGNGNISINKDYNNIEIASLTYFSYTDTIEFCITSLSDNSLETNINYIYPNPAKEIIFINYNNFNTYLPIFAEVYDVFGRITHKKTLDNMYMDVSDFKTGIYMINLKQENKIITEKIIIK